MNESGNSALDGNDGENEFLDWFKGLLITTNNTNQTSNQGAIYYIDLLSDYSKVTLFYRDTSGLSQDHDTIAFDFNLNANCARFHSSEINYTSTIVDATITDTSLGNELFYVQPLGGCKGKVYFPYLDALSDTSVMINKAELILPFQFYLLDLQVFFLERIRLYVFLVHPINCGLYILQTFHYILSLSAFDIRWF